MDRQAKLLRMKDVLEHLGACYDQWQESEPACASRLSEMMKRDLEQFGRLCDALRQDDESAGVERQAVLV